jgi:sensor histidine kinase YesM
MERQQQKKTKRRFFLESLAILLIIVTPFIFKAHEYIPEESSVSFFGIEITNNGFANVSIYIWFLLGKIIPLYLLIIWFLTCKHWWYHILLIPICMYAFQIFEVVYSDDKFIDTENVLWLLPVCMVVIPFVYFIRLKLFDKYVHGIDLEAMDAELQYYKNKEREQLQKIGIRVAETPMPDAETELSNETPKRTLNEIFQNLQHAMKSILSF